MDATRRRSRSISRPVRHRSPRSGGPHDHRTSPHRMRHRVRLASSAVLEAHGGQYLAQSGVVRNRPGQRESSQGSCASSRGTPGRKRGPWSRQGLRPQARSVPAYARAGQQRSQPIDNEAGEDRHRISRRRRLGLRRGSWGIREARLRRVPQFVAFSDGEEGCSVASPRGDIRCDRKSLSEAVLLRSTPGMSRRVKSPAKADLFSAMPRLTRRPWAAVSYDLRRAATRSKWPHRSYIDTFRRTAWSRIVRASPLPSISRTAAGRDRMPGSFSFDDLTGRQSFAAPSRSSIQQLGHNSDSSGHDTGPVSESLRCRDMFAASARGGGSFEDSSATTRNRLRSNARRVCSDQFS
jgi:hypothetical protein